MRIHKTYLLFIAVVVINFPVLAKNRSGADSALSLGENEMKGKMEEVVITGQYAPGSVEKAVHKINVIDRKKIDAMSAVNLRDVLTNQMNIRIDQDNVLGSSMSMQGISGENVKILIDGVPVIGRQNGNIDLTQINLNNIERIEIVEGPMSVNFGTNALAGTINLITKKTQANRWEGGLNTYYESIGTYNLSGRAGYSDKHNTVLLSGGRNFFDGWKQGEQISFSNAPVLADSNRVMAWKPKEQHFADAQYIYRQQNTIVNYKLGYFKETIWNLGMPGVYGETALDDHYHTYRTDNAVYLNQQLNKGKNFNVFVAYNDYKRISNTYYRDLTNLNATLTESAGDQDTSKFNSWSSRGSFNKAKGGDKVNYQLGYDVSIDGAYGIRIKDSEQKIGDYAAFGTFEYNPADRITIRPGLRVAYNTNYKAPLIPSVNLRYKIMTGLTLRASYAKGFRSPTLKELYFYFVDVNHNIQGNERLKAEYSDNYTANISYVKMFGNNALKIDAGGYYNDINNMITLAMKDFNATEYTYANIGKFKTLGGNLSAQFKVEHLTLSLGTAYIGRYNQYASSAGLPLYTWSPEVNQNIMYELPKHGITIATFLKYTGPTPGYSVDADENVVQTNMTDYSMADASVAKRFFKNRLALTLGCKNIFNVTNVTSSINTGGAHSVGSSSRPVGMGRMYFLKMDVNLYSNK